jgi:hypothetical protein
LRRPLATRFVARSIIAQPILARPIIARHVILGVGVAREVVAPPFIAPASFFASALVIAGIPPGAFARLGLRRAGFAGPTAAPVIRPAALRAARGAETLACAFAGPLTLPVALAPARTVVLPLAPLRPLVRLARRAGPPLGTAPLAVLRIPALTRRAAGRRTFILAPARLSSRAVGGAGVITAGRGGPLGPAWPLVRPLVWPPGATITVFHGEALA